MRRLAFYIVILFQFCISIVAQGFNPSDDDLIKEGVKQLNELIEKNEENESKGLYENNNYVFSFLPFEDWIKLKSIDGGNANDFISETDASGEYTLLNADLVDFNSNTARNPRGVKLYICLASKFIAYDLARSNGKSINELVAQLRASEPNTNENIEINENSITELEILKAKYQNLIQEIVVQSNLLSTDNKAVYAFAKYKNYFSDTDGAIKKIEGHMSALYIEGEDLDAHRSLIASSLISFSSARSQYQNKSVLHAIRLVVNSAVNYFENLASPAQMAFDPDNAGGQDPAYYDELTRESREQNWDADVAKIAGELDQLGPSARSDLESDYFYDQKGLVNESIKDIIKEKCNILYRHTGVKLFFAFYDVNYTIPYNDQAAFIDRIWQESSLNNESQAILISVPTTLRDKHIYRTVTYNGIPSFSYPKIKSVGVDQSVNNAFNNALNDAQNIKQLFLEVFKAISKKRIIYSYFFRVDGKVLFTKSERSAQPGEDYISKLNFWYDKENFDLINDNVFHPNGPSRANNIGFIPEYVLDKAFNRHVLAVMQNTSKIHWFEHHLKEQYIDQYHEGYVNGELYKKYQVYFKPGFDRKDYPPISGIRSDEDIVLNIIDAASIVLTPWGLDFVAEGAGFIYSTYKGDVFNATIYGASIGLVGVSAVVVRKFMLQAGEVAVTGAKASVIDAVNSLPYNADNIAQRLDIGAPLANSLHGTENFEVIFYYDELVTKTKSLGNRKGFFFNDLYNNNDLILEVANRPEIMDAWKLMDDAGETIKDIPELRNVVDNIDDVNAAGGYRAWKLGNNPNAFYGISDDAIDLTGEIERRLISLENQSGGNYLDLIIHGDGDKFVVDGELISSGDLAVIIAQKNTTGNAIRLLSCSDLESAKDLAQTLGVRIIANDGITRLHLEGGISAVSRLDGSDAIWKEIEIDGSIIRDVDMPSPRNQDDFIELGRNLDDLNPSALKFSEINRNNFADYFKEITAIREASQCGDNCTVVAISVAKKLRGEPILESGLFSSDFVSNGEAGLQILESYLNKINPITKPGELVPNVFPHRPGADPSAYAGNANNRVFITRLFQNVPNNSSFILGSYKGTNYSGFTGHAFNVIKDENGVIKFFDVQLANNLEYDEGIDALINKMAKHGLVNTNLTPAEISSWHIFDANNFKQ